MARTTSDNESIRFPDSGMPVGCVVKEGSARLMSFVAVVSTIVAVFAFDTVVVCVKNRVLVTSIVEGC
jgi:hypothetical protein